MEKKNYLDWSWFLTDGHHQPFPETISDLSQGTSKNFRVPQVV